MTIIEGKVWVLREHHEQAISAKDLEIEKLKRELSDTKSFIDVSVDCHARKRFSEELESRRKENERYKKALEEVLDKLPYAISETTHEITVHDKSGGRATMGNNMTKEFVKAIKEAETALQSGDNGKDK